MIQTQKLLLCNPRALLAHSSWAWSCGGMMVVVTDPTLCTHLALLMGNKTWPTAP